MAILNKFEQILSGWSSELQSIFRIMAAFTFIQHGIQKLFAFPTPFPIPFERFSLTWTGGVLELVGGFLLLVGLFTQPVAFVLSGEMAVAYFMVHAPRGFWTVANGGDLAVVYCFAFLYLAAAGGGNWSLDRVLRKPARSGPVS